MEQKKILRWEIDEQCRSIVEQESKNLISVSGFTHKITKRIEDRREITAHYFGRKTKCLTTSCG